MTCGFWIPLFSVPDLECSGNIPLPIGTEVFYSDSTDRVQVVDATSRVSSNSRRRPGQTIIKKRPT